jgi:hypothetical protein
MTDRNCPICFGLGWVCENHPDKAWDKSIGCECGAGTPCDCNSGGEFGEDEPDTSGILIQENFHTKH